AADVRAADAAVARRLGAHRRAEAVVARGHAHGLGALLHALRDIRRAVLRAVEEVAGLTEQALATGLVLQVRRTGDDAAEEEELLERHAVGSSNDHAARPQREDVATPDRRRRPAAPPRSPSADARA